MLPPELIHKFRGVAVERLERVEAAWARVLSSLDEEAATIVHREIHTLKAESRVVGFTDINLICHKLEDLLDVARSRGYAVDDDLDLLVHMALQFMTMLLNKKLGMTAIDLPGFVRQIDGILKRHERGRSRSGSVPPALRTAATPRVSPALRDQLGPAAVDAFVEYAVAKDVRRERLRASWHLLRDLIGVDRAIVSAAQTSNAQASWLALARDLGKQIELAFDVATVEVTSEAWSAIDAATLHLVRNAIDHGIEPPDEREKAGKRAIGTIRIRGSAVDGAFVLVVEDDGAGIDFAGVQRRAHELGLVADGQPVSEDRLVELMCHPGFSTRSEPNEVSGRGVGLDVVRGHAIDLGGSVTARSERGRGTTWTVTIPVPPLTVRGHVIRAPGLRFPVVIETRWQLLDRPTLPAIVDLSAALGLAPSNSISAHVWSFRDAALEVGFLCGGRPAEIQARRLVLTRPTALAEVVTVDAVEGLLVRPERIPGVR
ncbi:MAG TPA: ATP-binding protein [Kofleriaceae bacterium]|nr:ATP-binding protein [Kofleriaceae bacterium]